MKKQFSKQGIKKDLFPAQSPKESHVGGAIFKTRRSKTGEFCLMSSFVPSGDQPKAIKAICDNLKKRAGHQTLLGVTGSGKTFTMAHIIQKMQKPSLILAPNKTLAAQLFAELKEIFPKNAVEYFVSYYDYYQPEAYIPSTDTYIEKDSSINDFIDRMRHSATMALFERRDVIVVCSVSCIYGLGSPEDYYSLMINVELNQKMIRDRFLQSLVNIQYERSDFDFHRGTFRVRGDRVDILPAYEDEHAYSIEFFGDYIDSISIVDSITGEIMEEGLQSLSIYPGSHYVSSQAKNKMAIQSIRKELKSHTAFLKNNKKLLEQKRLAKRTLYDLEIIEEMGTCPGVENYSRHFTGRLPGQAPPTLLEYFPKDYLLFVDESHITIPQVGGMYRGDRSRKQTLVEHGFRLPSALDNRPLNFKEFEGFINQVVYVSATPGDYEIRCSKGHAVEQIIRPTGLVDPEISVRPVGSQVEDLLKEIKIRRQKKERVLVNTLTKRMAENLTSYYQKKGVEVRYLHSDIKTIERMELLKDLRLGVFQVLIGINLLREGLDLPEVSLVGVMDADKEGFLRSKRSLIQVIGRAARHINGQVILYADTMTDSIEYAVFETNRRRRLQMQFNRKHKIKVKSIKKSPPKALMEIYGFNREADPHDIQALLNGKQINMNKTNQKIQKEITALKKEMKKASQSLNFEKAVKLRDQIKRLSLCDLDNKNRL